MAFKDKLKEARDYAGISQVELSELLNVNQSAISHWEKGNRTPDLETINKLTEILGVSVDFLIGTTTVPDGVVVNRTKIMTHSVFVYGHIPAGTPFEAIEDIIEDVSIPDWLAKKKDLFGLKVVGDSMNKVLPDGCIAILQKVDTLDNGDIGAILVNGYDATIKRFFKLTDSIVLEPLSFNDNHKPIIIQNEEETVKPIGKLMWFCASKDMK